MRRPRTKKKDTVAMVNRLVSFIRNREGRISIGELTACANIPNFRDGHRWPTLQKVRARLVKYGVRLDYDSKTKEYVSVHTKDIEKRAVPAEEVDGKKVSDSLVSRLTAVVEALTETIRDTVVSTMDACRESREAACSSETKPRNTKKVTVYFKKLRPDAKAPERAHEGDAGWDVYASTVEDVGILGYRPVRQYGTGLALAVPKGYWVDVRARSSIYRTGMILANGVGTVDSGYRGEVKATFYQSFCIAEAPRYDVGSKIAQLVVQPALTTDVEFVEVDELPPSDDGRGEGGFGSTGK